MNHIGIAGHTFTISGFAIILISLAVWSLIWKGFAVWYAARNYQRAWFVVLLVINTAGILDIIYLVFFRRDKRPGVTKSLFDNPLPDPAKEDAVAETPRA